MELSVNIDHVATVRQARGGEEPSPITAASIAELAGACGIVCHLREDRRHINDDDLRLLREVVQTKLNMEMAATHEMIEIASDVLPDIVTLVPERREELTTEGGLDVSGRYSEMEMAVARLQQQGIATSFFIEPSIEQIDTCADIGANIVELHTGIYANARSASHKQAELEKLRKAAEHARSSGLIVAAGHGLNYHNIAPVCAIDAITEVSIGHAIISRAIFSGLDTAVRDMITTIQRATLRGTGR